MVGCPPITCPMQKLPIHNICCRVKAHIPTPSATGKGISLGKMCKKADLGAGFGAWWGWPTLQQPAGQAVPRAARGVEIGAADVWNEEPAPKGVWSSVLGKARGKPGKAASQGGRTTFLDVILFLVLKRNDKSVSRRA